MSWFSRGSIFRDLMNTTRSIGYTANSAARAYGKTKSAKVDLMLKSAILVGTTGMLVAKTASFFVGRRVVKPAAKAAGRGMKKSGKWATKKAKVQMEKQRKKPTKEQKATEQEIKDSMDNTEDNLAANPNEFTQNQMDNIIDPSNSPVFESEELDTEALMKEQNIEPTPMVYGFVSDAPRYLQPLERYLREKKEIIGDYSYNKEEDGFNLEVLGRKLLMNTKGIYDLETRTELSSTYNNLNTATSYLISVFGVQDFTILYSLINYYNTIVGTHKTQTEKFLKGRAAKPRKAIPTSKQSDSQEDSTKPTKAISTKASSEPVINGGEVVKNFVQSEAPAKKTRNIDVLDKLFVNIDFNSFDYLDYLLEDYGEKLTKKQRVELAQQTITPISTLEQFYPRAVKYFNESGAEGVVIAKILGLCSNFNQIFSRNDILREVLSLYPTKIFKSKEAKDLFIKLVSEYNFKSQGQPISPENAEKTLNDLLSIIESGSSKKSPNKLIKLVTLGISTIDSNYEQG